MDGRSATLGTALTLVMTTVLVVPGALAQTWSLEQNDPNPFCPTKEGTSILFSVVEQTHVLVEVLDPEDANVVRTLVDQVLAVGLHLVFWDGRDDQGVFVLNGSYPYRMVAGDPPIFEDTKIASVVCPTAVENLSWGVVKSKYNR